MTNKKKSKLEKTTINHNKSVTNNISQQKNNSGFGISNAILHI